MSTTLMHSEYHPTPFVTGTRGIQTLCGWLQTDADELPEKAEQLNEAITALVHMKGDEPYSCEQEAAKRIAATLKASAERKRGGTADQRDNAVREHLSELAEAMAGLADNHEILHLSMV